MAEALTDGDERARALGTIAHHLSEPERTTLFEDALVAARHGDRFGTATAIASFSPLPASTTGGALAAARDRSDADAGGAALAQVAVNLTGQRKSHVLDEALTEAGVEGRMTVPLTFEGTAASLTHHVFEAVIENIERADSPGFLWEAFAPHVPADLLPRAVEVASARSSLHRRKEALLALAPRSEAAAGDALTALLKTRESWRIVDLQALAPYLSSGVSPRKVTNEILAACRDLKSSVVCGSSRSEPLTAQHAARLLLLEDESPREGPWIR